MTANQDSTTEDAAAQATDRLESALERIAALAARPVEPADPEIAKRLDTVIAKLRAGLRPGAA